MTQSDKDPLWEPPKKYSNLPEFDDLFQELMKHNRQGQCWIKPRGNDQRKLRNFLRNISVNEAPPPEDYFDIPTFEEWSEVFEILMKGLDTKDPLKMFETIKEMDDWCEQYYSWYKRYREKKSRK